jgi:cellobiose phosphorylase
MLVQHLTAFFNVGEHNVIKLEGADWNDGMDMARKRGESVAFTAFYASNLSELGQMALALEARGVTEVALAVELLPLLDTLNAPVVYENVQAKQAHLEAFFNTCQHTISGKKVTITTRDLAHDLERKSAWLFEHLRQQEWLTNRAGHGWFNGYYDDNGGRVEGDHPNGVRMTLTGQVFALMGGIATDEQARAIIKAADQYLLEPSMGGYRLNTDFGDIQLALGRCFGFALGHKENGAMFSHMTVMYANALYQRGFVREAYTTLSGFYEHCRDFAKSRIYPGVPEYINPRGRGMYTYLTGSASWLLLTLVTESFGVKGRLGDLILAPRLVTEQFDAAGRAALITQFAGKRLEVTYHNPLRLDYGQYLIRKITLNGTTIDLELLDAGALIPRHLIEALSAAQRVHHIEVELGEC